MKIYNIIAVAVISATLVACGNSDVENAQANLPAFNPSANTAPTALAPFHQDTANKSTSPVDVLNSVQSQPNTTSPATASNVKLNPPHGQPGHRCDIPDGAPLNSAPATAQTTAANTQKTNQVQSAVTPLPAANINTVKSTPSAKGLNPEHGQPGHRCEIAVGAPLDSKPTTAAQTQPSVITPTPAKTVTAPGMNPPHGEPGHKCEIAVGAPLNGDKKDGN